MRTLVMAAAMMCGMASAAQANLISDPGFENAPFGGRTNGASFGDGWSADPAAFAANGANAHAGRNYMILDTAGSGRVDGGVRQTVLTTAGTDYTLSFWAASNADTGVFSVTFGGVAVLGIPSALPNTGTGSAAYRQYVATVTASGESSVLAFNVTGTDGGTGRFTRLDDVSLEVAAVPEPAAWALMIVGFGGVAGAMRRRSGVRTRVRFA